MTYDKNGNITALSRKGYLNMQATSFGMMDDLIYSYDSGNKLVKVLDNGNDLYGFKDGADHTTEYSYDNNGNLVSDTNKGITRINYNHLNLPVKVVFNNSDTQTISYRYAADGSKLRKVVNDNGVIIRTDYAGNYIYENNQLQFFNHPEGYVKNDNSIFNYVYQYKDHLGNIRLSYIDSNSDGQISQSEIIEESNYYPFGLKHKGYNNVINGIENNYKTYLGKEINKEFGLNWITFRHRNYMLEIGRFFGVDPVAGDYVTISSYQFAHNNPVWKIELEGLEGQERFGFDVLNAPPSGQSGKNPAAHLPLPVGDQSSGTTSGNKNIRKLVATQKLSVEQRIVTGYPGQALEELTTKGIQWGASKISGSDVSRGTADNVQMTADFAIFLFSKGKNVDAGTGIVEGLVKKKGDDVIEQGTKVGKKSKVKLPGLDSTGKVHGDLPDIKDLGKYSKDELTILKSDLKKSVQTRIDVTKKKGPSATKMQNKQHGERQAQEQNLIKSIEKYLKNN